ncbi:class I SAM-dependent methyltransferase [Pantoea agglomerans]|nr:class I SAM-dependent methyltransferase [Pantoea agglomerans]
MVNHPINGIFILKLIIISFPDNKKTLKNLLEIGVQNGGSLEIWSKYFPNAENIVGCDINPDCARLEYENKSIKVLIGNSSTLEIKNKISEITPSYNLIIDDGSHNSSDIIKSFFTLLPYTGAGWCLYC